MVRQVSTRGRTFTVEDLPLSEGFDFWTQAYESGWESDTHSILEKNLTLDTVLLDIGAWVGPFTLFSSSLCRAVLALEPDPIAFDMLEKNIQHNNLQNTIVCQKALWDGSDVTLGVKESGDMGDSMTSILYSECSRTIIVSSITLESLVDKYSLDLSKLFIKMDIEGAEADALLMNWSFIREYLPPMWLSLHTPLIEDSSSYIKKIQKITNLYGMDFPIPVGFESILLTRGYSNGA